MFDGSNPRPLAAHRAAGIVTEVATEAWQLRAYHQLRQRVFVGEQGLFDRSDEDDVDAGALAIVAMTQSFGMPDQVVGTVRIFPGKTGQGESQEPHGNTVWYGGRLAVDAVHRRHGLVGEALIRAAVCSAHALGCTRFLATVQLPVVRYFERRHFAVCGEVWVCGVPHALMQADLAFYPPKYFGRLGDFAGSRSTEAA